MKLKLPAVLLFATACMIFSCKKEHDPAYCCQLLDPFGNDLNSVCDKSVAEMKSMYPNSCSYYKIEGEAYCWLVDGRAFIEHKTEHYINLYSQCYGGGAAVKVACDYCARWYTRQKNIYKPTNTFTYSPVHFQQYCGDTAHSLFQGREIVLRESADSLIKLQFSKTPSF